MLSIHTVKHQQTYKSSITNLRHRGKLKTEKRVERVCCGSRFVLGVNESVMMCFCLQTTFQSDRVTLFGIVVLALVVSSFRGVGLVPRQPQAAAVKRTSHVLNCCEEHLYALQEQLVFAPVATTNTSPAAAVLKPSQHKGAN